MNDRGFYTLMMVASVILLVVGIFLVSYYFNHVRDECLRSPLNYGAKQIEERTGYEFYGYGYYRFPDGSQSPLIIFNSTSTRVSNP